MILRLILSVITGIISNGVLCVELNDRFQKGDSLLPSFAALVLSVGAAVLTWIISGGPVK